MPPAPRVEVRNPLLRTPLALIIDDSCPVINKAWYWIRDRHDWRIRHQPDSPPLGWERHYDRLPSMPDAIPADFVRRWGEWCAAEGIKGKFSAVPFPAGMGRIDRGFPGFPRAELEAWLRAVDEVIRPGFDITPEMITHTRVVDLESWTLTEEWEQGEWVDPPGDRLAAYVTAAMRLLRNAGIACEGVTSPGAFGRDKEDAYARAVLDASVEVNGNPRPFYFLHVRYEGIPDVPLHHVRKDAGEAVASIVACAGDWFGATGYDEADPDLFITEDLRGGRLPAVLAAGAPCIMVGHWPCFFVNDEIGFGILKTVKRRLDAFDPDRTRTIWMKTSEIAHYQMAREMAQILPREGGVRIRSAFPSGRFTLSVHAPCPRVRVAGRDLRRASSVRDFTEGTFLAEGGLTHLAFELSAGETVLDFAP